MKTRRAILLVTVLVGGLTLAGCDENGGEIIIVDQPPGIATVENQSPWAVVVDPYGVLLLPGEAVDLDVGSMTYVVVFREFDGLILLEADILPGEIWIVQ